MILGGNFIFSLSFIVVGFVLCHILGSCRLSPVAPAEPRGLLALGGPQAWHLLVPTGLDVGPGTSGVPPRSPPPAGCGSGPSGLACMVSFNPETLWGACEPGPVSSRDSLATRVYQPRAWWADGAHVHMPGVQPTSLPPLPPQDRRGSH